MAEPSRPHGDVALVLLPEADELESRLNDEVGPRYLEDGFRARWPGRLTSFVGRLVLDHPDAPSRRGPRPPPCPSTTIAGLEYRSK